jgi:hypothetical protein
MPIWLALAAALAAPPTPEGPAPGASSQTPAPAGPPAEPESAPAASEGPAPGPTAVPKIPSPREAQSGTGPKGPALPDNPAALGLKRMRDGSMLYVDPGKRFTAAFNDDGTVRFGDRWGRDQHGRRMRGSGWELRQVGLNGLGIGGPAEWLLAMQDRMGGPERHAAAKAEFLARTAELRTAMTIAWTLRLLDFRLNALNQELFALWTAPGSAAAAKRELIFQRWDECDEAFAVGPEGEITEEAASAIDRARAETAEKARRIIEAFVRRQLPRGSASGYTAAELKDMNKRRRSKQAFEPYKTR